MYVYIKYIMYNALMRTIRICLELNLKQCDENSLDNV